MVKAPTRNLAASRLAQENLPIARSVAWRLMARYPWIPADDLYDYSLWGLLMAAHAYSPDRGSSFATFARWKSVYLAVDRMRTEKVLRRAPADGHEPGPRYRPLSPDIPDPRSGRPMAAVDAEDSLRSTLRILSVRDRQLLLMYYSDGLTLREIARVLHISEATVCLRRKALLARLRQSA